MQFLEVNFLFVVFPPSTVQCFVSIPCHEIEGSNTQLGIELFRVGATVAFAESKGLKTTLTALVTPSHLLQ